MTTIHLFGNPDLPEDALAPSLYGDLKKTFPEFRFRLTDPNELDLPGEGEDFIGIDVVEGLKATREIAVSEIAEMQARSTAHDFDFASYLLLVRKLRPMATIRILGLPLGIKKEEALVSLLPFLKSFKSPGS